MRQRTFTTRRGFGFTLIELLVVIAIIAILAAILFPVFGRARAKSHAASCLSNIKQCTLALLMYADDEDGKFPLSWPSANPDLNPPTFDTGPWPAWYVAVKEYQDNDKVFKCPSAKDPVGYGFNIYMVERALTSVAKPGEKIMLAEINTTSLKPQWQWGWGASMSPPHDGDWPYNDFPNRHLGGINVGFVDGHADWCKLYYGWDSTRPSRSNILTSSNWY